MRSTFFTVPEAEVTDDSRLEISLSRSSSAISGRTININSYVRFISVSKLSCHLIQALLAWRRVQASRAWIASLFLFPVEPVHCRRRSFRQNHLHRFFHGVKHLVHDFQFLLLHRREQVVSAFANFPLRRDSNPDP